MDKVLVAGATGNVGRQVVAQLVAAGVPTRALARDPETTVFPPGVEVAGGDLTAPESLVAAVDGIDSVFLVWPLHSTEGATKVVAALAAQGRRVVYLSSTAVNDAGPQSDLIPLLHAEMEASVKAATTQWTILRADALASNSLSLARQVRAGDVVRGTEVAPSAAVHEGDVAAVAVRLLTEAGHIGRTYLATGPRVVGRAERVEAIGAALGRPLRFETLTVAAAREMMTAAGLPAPQIESLVSMTEFRPRSDLITDTVATFTGRPARDIREWSAEHVEDFR